MARARNIKPGFFTNDVLAQCEPGARLVFIGLWTLADREGRLEDRPLRIKAQIMPYDKCNVDNYMGQLADTGFITRYSLVENGTTHKYIQVNNFVKHQSPHVKEPASTIPAPDKSGANSPDCGLRIPDTGLLNDESSVSCPQADDPQFTDFWNTFPRLRRTAKGKARTAWRQALRKTTAEVILEAVAEYAASETGSGEFVKMPASWLNGECWDDDRESWRANGAPKRNRIPTAEDNANWNPHGGDE